MLQLSKFILFVLREKWKGGGDGIEKKKMGIRRKMVKDAATDSFWNSILASYRMLKKKKKKNASDKIFSGLALPNFPEQSFQSI